MKQGRPIKTPGIISKWYATQTDYTSLEEVAQAVGVSRKMIHLYDKGLSIPTDEIFSRLKELSPTLTEKAFIKWWKEDHPHLITRYNGWRKSRSKK